MTRQGLSSFIMCALQLLCGNVVCVCGGIAGGNFRSCQACVLRMGIRGLWSVTTVKWSSPERKSWHFLTAQATAKHSSSMTMYLVSVSVRNVDSRLLLPLVSVPLFWFIYPILSTICIPSCHCVFASNMC